MFQNLQIFDITFNIEDAALCLKQNHYGIRASWNSYRSLNMRDVQPDKSYFVA